MPGTKQSINHYQSYSSPVCFLVQGTRGSWLLILIAGSVWVGTKDIYHRGDLGVGRVGAMGRMAQKCGKSLKNVTKQWGQAQKVWGCKKFRIVIQVKVTIERLIHWKMKQSKASSGCLAFVFSAHEEVQSMVLGWRGTLAFSTAARGGPVTDSYTTSETTVNWPVSSPTFRERRNHPFSHPQRPHSTKSPLPP